MFKFDGKTHAFEEDAQLKIVLEQHDDVEYVTFDRQFENIFILKNAQTLEKRSMSAPNLVTMSIELDGDGGYCISQKELVLSGDGSMCAVGPGQSKTYFYLIDLQSKTQQKLTSAVLKDIFSPCFINGDAEYVAVGGDEGQGVEIWDVQTAQPVKRLQIDGLIGSMASTNNILAVGSYAGTLQLWDVRNWEMFQEFKYDDFCPTSLHLTSDAKYLTIGELMGKSIVMKIK